MVEIFFFVLDISKHQIRGWIQNFPSFCDGEDCVGAITIIFAQIEWSFCHLQN